MLAMIQRSFVKFEFDALLLLGCLLCNCVLSSVVKIVQIEALKSLSNSA